MKTTQKQNTIEQMNRLINSGVQKIDITDMQILLSEIGLKLCLDKNNYLFCYYNTSNEHKFFEATTSPLDKQKISCYNINSKFYQENFKGLKTEKYNKLKELRNKYFCTIRKNNNEYILSF